MCRWTGEGRVRSATYALAADSGDVEASGSAVGADAGEVWKCRGGVGGVAVTLSSDLRTIAPELNSAGHNNTTMNDSG